MYLLLVVIAGYSKQAFDASDSLAGLVVGLFIVGSLIGRFATGKFVNQIGPKRLLFIGLIALIITQLLYFIDGSLAFNLCTSHKRYRNCSCDNCNRYYCGIRYPVNRKVKASVYFP